MTWATTAAYIAIAVAAAGAAASYDSGQRQLYATTKAAHDNQEIQNKQLEEQRQQIAKQAANDETERMRASQQETSKLRVISGESGALGITSDRLLQDSKFQEGSDIATIEANKVSALKQTDLTGLSNYNQNTSTVNQAANRAPTLLGTGLQIAGSAANTYMGYRAATAKVK